VLLAGLLGGSDTVAEGARGRGDTLRARVGIGAAESLAASDALSERLRGLERLGTIGTPRAVLRLVRALEPGGSAKAPEERLTAVRELAIHTDDPTARRALARVLGGHSAPSSTDAPSDLDALAERTAALALARSASPDALASLGKALESSGRAAAAAGAALVAHPPDDLAAVLAAARVPSLALVKALDELGDQRSFDTLRELVRIGTPEVRAAAAVALTRLGDYETVELSRRWVTGNEPPVLHLAGARILAMAHAADAPRAIAGLLRDPSTLSAGVALALEAPNEALVPELSRLLATASGERADDLVAAIGRAGGKRAAGLLGSLLSDRSVGPIAAYQLARMPGDDASRLIARGLGSPTTRRLAARAGTVRMLLTGERVESLARVLEDLVRSKDAADRAAGAAGLSVLDPDRTEAFLESTDDAVVRAAASCLLLASTEVAIHVAERLLDPARGDTRTALALALAVPGAAARAPTAALLALVDGGGPAAPLAALALGARDAANERERLDELQTSSDPSIRAHVALGLGASTESDAGGRLEASYRLETDASVRAAIIRALSARNEPARRRLLARAQALDPDADVRAAAKASANRTAAVAGRAVAWVPVVESGTDRPIAATVAVEVPGGLVLPAAVPPDGLVVLSGLPPGPIVLRVAPAHDHDNSSGRGIGWHPVKQRP
jgi:HEAT repeat protein